MAPKTALEKVHFILYVADQRRSAEFYSRVLGYPPDLDVPGMTEFELPGGSILGLMPEEGVRRLLGPSLPDLRRAQGIPRSELYLVVDDPRGSHERAIKAGAVELSAVQPRDWGHSAGYSLDPDGHVVAFAEVDEGA
jgi:catechol 2,3-dioxygenase-like lactoylglutathione lyase family enzyme